MTLGIGDQAMLDRLVLESMRPVPPPPLSADPDPDQRELLRRLLRLVAEAYDPKGPCSCGSCRSKKARKAAGDYDG